MWVDKSLALPYNLGMAIRSRLKEIRESRRMERRELAERAKVHYNTVRFIENGKVIPTVVVARRLANVLGSSIDELFPGRG